MGSLYLRVGVVIAVLAAGGVYLFWHDDFPAPAEARRVRSAQGLSIIVPPGWVKDDPGVIDPRYREVLTFVPEETSRWAFRFSVCRYVTRGTPALSAGKRFSPVTFQGQPAMFAEKSTKALSNYRLVFDRDGETFEINSSVSDRVTGPGDGWWKYWETFRFERAATQSAAASP